MLYILKANSPLKNNNVHFFFYRIKVLQKVSQCQASADISMTCSIFFACSINYTGGLGSGCVLSLCAWITRSVENNLLFLIIYIFLYKFTYIFFKNHLSPGVQL